ncbi:hypothetical protein FHS27_000515 [Rhodopirellula rubra]|uniref:HEAT repeat domain-containing protein n=1 Tax=Aporhodopirellula rubra TaxID=980271 RepID=A0A7W5DVB9_9BACT|nr:hypothetical protein [Aporhodopirellula rubra]MBB3204748.1 hypothetical protein [Aporhodopirellula rubra]
MIDAAYVVQEQECLKIDLYDRQRGFGNEFQQLSDIADQLAIAPRFGPTATPKGSKIARDAGHSPKDRLKGFQEWLVESPDAAALFVADQLRQHRNMDVDWLEAMVRAAEAVVFPSECLSSVAQSLLGAAETFRHRDEFGSAEICWCALHRAGSLLPTDQIDLLRPFLQNDAHVDTRLVALQAVSSIVDVAPLSDNAEAAELISRIESLGKKVLEADVFSAGELSAIGIECTMNLAGLSPDCPNALVDRVLALDREWLTNIVIQRYEELIASWRNVGVTLRQVAVLENDLSRLRDNVQ